MPKYCSVLVSLWLLSLPLFVEAQFTDDFSDGEFTSNPVWSGDDALFTVDLYPPDLTNQMLRSNSPGEADYYLSTPSSIVAETSWEFFFNLQFGTSGVNYFDAFLVADDANLNNVQNGYFLRFGSTDDDITFWKRVGGADELLIDGPDDQIGSSSNNPYNVRVTLNDAGLWTISLDEGATGSFSTFGTITDSEIATTVAFGFRIVQSGAASPVNSHWFDDIEVAEILPDLTPPSALSIETVSLTELLLTFDEPLDETSAESVNNYDLSPGIGAPQSAELDDITGTEVTLILPTELMNGASYTLNISDIADLNDNAMGLESLNFTVIIPEMAEFKDVVINEIMPDPNPVIGNLPEEEYLEIFNASDKYIQLENWELLNSGNPATFPSFLLEPGQHVIVCAEADAAAFEPFGDVIGLGSFAALTNGEDDLALNNAEGTLIDAVTYNDDWYGDSEKAEGGWSLELINPGTPCSGSQNWIASNDPNGGTPGNQNSVYDTTPDTNPPALIDFSIQGPQNLVLFFSEALDAASAENSDFTVEPDLGVSNSVVNPDLLSISLTLDNPVDTAVYYTVTVSGITDCIGNTIGDENSIEFVIGYTPQEYDVLINEIMADPTPEVGLPGQEYIELINTTNQLFDLSNCQISGNAFAQNTFIEPNQHLLLVSSAEFDYPDAEAVAVIPDLSSTFLTNSGRELLLLNEQSETIDRVNYSIDWYRDPDKTDGGWSLERINPEEPCRGGDNWQASVDAAGGTPGQQNSVYSTTADETAPQLQYILVIDSMTIELVFNEVLDETTAISAGYSFEPALTVFDIETTPPANESVLLTFSESLTPNQRHEITIFGLTDCTGNEYQNEDEVAFGRPAEPTNGNLILNEVLFNERTGGSDYVEVYNHSNAIISIRDWQLGNLDNDQYDLISETPFILFPGEYLAITEDKQNVLTEYPFAPAGRVLQADDIPTLNNSDGMVVLLSPSGETVDRFDYNEDMHFALLNDLDGVSLERIGFDRPSNDPTNWISAAEEFNWGTPGFENSQIQPSGETDDDVVVDPEIFSPDNDGYQDVLNINYEFDRSGLAGNITIYDASGREIRQLMRNDLLGTKGTISWDGTTDDGNRARVGIHVVFVEVFSADGFTKSYKLSCVVASRF